MLIEKYIIKYLNHWVEVKKFSEVYYIYLKDTDEIYYIDYLMDDINLLFGVSGEQAKNLVKKWCERNHLLESLTLYFDTAPNFIYMPYVPSMLTSMIMGVDPIASRPSIASRYSIRNINPDNYLTGIIRG